MTSVVALCASTPVAAAQDPQVDPDSPAGTEYALPVEHAARVAGAPARPAAGRAAAARPLFGEGIKRLSTGARQGRGDSAGSSPAPAASGDDAQRALSASAPDPSGSAIPWLLGSGGAVILIGVGLSRALQRVARPS